MKLSMKQSESGRNKKGFISISDPWLRTYLSITTATGTMPELLGTGV
jgi:hypothetical protein